MQSLESQHLVPLRLWEGITLLHLSSLICTRVTMTASSLVLPGKQVTESLWSVDGLHTLKDNYVNV